MKLYRPCAIIEFDQEGDVIPYVSALQAMMRGWPGCNNAIGSMPVFATRKDAEDFFIDRDSEGEVGEIEYSDT